MITEKEAKKQKTLKGKLDSIIYQLDKIKYWSYENNKLLRAILNKKEE